jgi:hypothetical protein
VSCAQLEQLEQLVDLPSEDQERVRRAARVLQQRLILKQWLTHHNLAQHYQRSVFFIYNFFCGAHLCDKGMVVN